MAFIIEKMALNFMESALFYCELTGIGNDHLHVGL